MAQTLNEALHERLDRMGGADPSVVDSTPLPDEVEEQDDDETPSPDAEDLEQSEVDEADEPEAEDEDVSDEDESAAEDTPTKWRLSEFAEATGLTVQDLYNDLLVPLGDGKEPVPLGELKHRVQALDEERSEVDQARAAIQQEYQQLQQQQQQFMQGTQAVSEEVRNANSKVAAIEAQYAQVDWEKLDETNPGQAANYRQKFATAYAAAQKELETAKQHEQQQREQAVQQAMVVHNQYLAEKLPHWRDPKVFEEESRQVAEALIKELGWDPDELMSIYHGPARATAYWAWKGLMAEKQQKEAVGKVRKAPKKILRPGKPTTGKQRSERVLQQLESRAIATGRQDDKLAAARAIVQASRRKG
jgi:hypothetical protein